MYTPEMLGARRRKGAPAVVFVHGANTQDMLSAGLPHGMVKLFLVIVVAEITRTLEREVEIQRQKLAGQKNQLLRDKTMKQLRSLEEDLRIKKGGLGMQDEDDDEE